MNIKPLNAGSADQLRIQNVRYQPEYCVCDIIMDHLLGSRGSADGPLAMMVPERDLLSAIAECHLDVSLQSGPERDSAMEKTPRVFVSMGTPYTDDYIRFRDALERLLRDQCHVDPRIVGKNEYPSGAPIEHINDIMQTCDGVIIVAYERKYVEKGVEKPGGPDQRTLQNAKYTTPWNHIESAIAYSLRLPLYIIAQRGLTEEGLIESKVDWYVQKIDFNEESLRRPEVLESLSAWIRERVVKKARRRRSPFENFLKLRLSELTIEEWIILTGGIATSFGAGVAAAKLIPSLTI